MVRALDLKARGSGSSPSPCHWMDLSSVAPNSNPTRFVNSQLVCLLQLGFLTMLFSFKLFVSFVSVACLQTSYLKAKCMTTINIAFIFLHFTYECSHHTPHWDRIVHQYYFQGSLRLHHTCWENMILFLYITLSFLTSTSYFWSQLMVSTTVQQFSLDTRPCNFGELISVYNLTRAVSTS